MVVINDTIFANVPFLNSSNTNDIATVNKAKEESMYILQVDLKKSDTDVLNESTYTNQERLLIAYYTSYNIVETKALANIGGIGGESPTGSVFVSKEKADVVEIEYEAPNSSDGTVLNMSTKEVLNGLKLKVCTLANKMNIRLVICKEFCEKVQVVPIKYFPNCK